MHQRKPALTIPLDTGALLSLVCKGDISPHSENNTNTYDMPAGSTSRWGRETLAWCRAKGARTPVGASLESDSALLRISKCWLCWFLCFGGVPPSWQTLFVRWAYPLDHSSHPNSYLSERTSDSSKTRSCFRHEGPLSGLTYCCSNSSPNFEA